MRKLTEEDLEEMNGAFSVTLTQALCAGGMAAATHYLGFAVGAAFGPVGLVVYEIGAAVGSTYVCSEA